MSDFSPILVLQIKICIKPDRLAKVAIKSEKLTPFGGIFSIIEQIVEFYNLRGGKERIFDDMNNGFGWNRLPKSFMGENTVFLLLTALIRNFYKFIMARLDVKIMVMILRIASSRMVG